MDKQSIDVQAEYFYETKNKLLEFCKKCEHIFIYGAGKYGKLCFDFLHEQSIDIEGFLVTEKNEVEYLGRPIYVAKEKMPLMCSKTGIIFALRKNYQQDVKRSLPNVKNVEFFEAEDCFFQYYRLSFMFETFKRINVSAPAEKLEYKHNNWHKILIVRLDNIGDMIWTTAFFRELKRNFPKSKVTLVMRKAFCSIIEILPYIDKIILYDCGIHEGLVSKLMAERARIFAQQYLIKEEYDVIFLPRLLPRDPYDFLDNIFLAMYSGAKYRIARADYIEPLEKKICLEMEELFSVVVKHDKVDHEVVNILKLLEVCGAKIHNDKMELWLKDRDENFVKNLLQRDEIGMPLYIAVALVSNDENRTWDIANYINLMRTISSKYGQKIKFVLLGGENASLAGYVAEKSKLDGHILNLINKTTLPQVAALIKYCDMYLGSNTGLLHIASTFGKPVVEISAHLHGGKRTELLNPERVGAWHVYSRVIKPKGLGDCKDMCRKPYAHCINQITAEEVKQNLEEMIRYVLLKKKEIDKNAESFSYYTSI